MNIIHSETMIRERQLTSTEFEKHLVELLSAYRDGDIFSLYESPLLKSPLFQDILFLDETIALATSPEIASAVINWGIDQFKPRGEPDWYSNLWRPYVVLHGFYIDKQTIATLAEKLGIADQTFYEWRSVAIGRLSKLLYRECFNPTKLADRQKKYVAHKIQPLNEVELQSLALITLNRNSDAGARIFSQEERVVFKKLEQLYLVDLKTFSQPDELKNHILSYISQSHQLAAHRVLFKRFNKQQLIRAAVDHGLLAGDLEETIKLAAGNREALFKENDLTGLSDLFQSTIFAVENQLNIEPNLWARFLLIASRVAQWEDNLDQALNLSRQALSAPDLEVKLHAYFQRAKQLSRVNLDECLSHYAVCFDLVERMNQSISKQQSSINKLVTQMYIDRAWIFIQDRPDYARAGEDLNQAETFIPAEASGLWCDLYNGRAELVARTQSAKDALPFHLKAYTSAEESGDIERMTKLAYNVGLDYMYSDQYESSLSYFEKSQKWAEQSGNVQTLGLAQKGLGGSHFFLENFDLALGYYSAAYNTWKPTQNISWLTSICFDLAEGHATINDFVNARIYYHEGQSLADQLGHERFIAEFESLKKQFPALEEEISDRQALALASAERNNGISRQQYIDLTGVAKSQAYRDLEEMCKEGLLVRVGQGRGTKYVRPD